MHLCAQWRNGGEVVNLYVSVPFFYRYLKIAVIERAATLNTNTWWWIKGDGVDMVKALWESVKGQWVGDFDLNDGELQLLYQKLQNQLQWVEEIGLEQ